MMEPWVSLKHGDATALSRFSKAILAEIGSVCWLTTAVNNEVLVVLVHMTMIQMILTVRDPMYIPDECDHSSDSDAVPGFN